MKSTYDAKWNRKRISNWNKWYTVHCTHTHTHPLYKIIWGKGKSIRFHLFETYTHWKYCTIDWTAFFRFSSKFDIFWHFTHKPAFSKILLTELLNEHNIKILNNVNCVFIRLTNHSDVCHLLSVTIRRFCRYRITSNFISFYFICRSRVRLHSNILTQASKQIVWQTFDLIPCLINEYRIFHLFTQCRWAFASNKIE